MTSGRWTITGLLLVAALMMVAAGPVKTRHPKRRRPSATAQRKSRQLKQKLQSVRSERSAISAQLHATQRKARVAKMNLDQADEQLQDATNSLYDTQAALERDTARQQQLSAEVVVANAELESDKKSIAVRLKGMYEEGDTPAIAVFLGAQSSSDLAGNAYLLSRVAAADHKALDAFKSASQKVADQKAEQDRLVAGIAREKSDETIQQANLQSARDDKAQVVEDLQHKKATLQETLDQIDRDEAQIEQQILEAQRVPSSSGGPIHFSGRFIAPVNAPVTSSFGMRYHPILHIYRLHAGVDLGARYGTPIKAAAAGVVIAAQYMRGDGNAVILDNGGGYSTVYAHCSVILVHKGERVTQGQVIAKVGATGLATGPHLHFEIRINGKPVNPIGRFAR